MKKVTLSLFFLIFCKVTFGQLTVNTGTLTPLQYVQDFLIGEGIQVSNVTFNNSDTYNGNQIGKFAYNGNQIQFASGILLSSGGVTGAAGPNNVGNSSVTVTAPALNNDPEIDAISSVVSRDVAKLEFDFTPVGNSVTFNFLFGSEEYNEFVCSTVNDAFGFFVSGANPDGGNYVNTNLALVPNTVGTTNIPISINTVNNGTAAGSATNCSSIDPNWQANSIYFAGAPGTHFQADGMTYMINVKFKVFCDSTYHFKFAIADGGDAIYDSWVFLQDNSFASPPIDVKLQTEVGLDSIPESCVNAKVYFMRSSCGSQDTLVVDYSLSGTATDSLDFEIEDGPIVLLPGQLIDSVSITTYADNLVEGNETIIIGYTFVDANGMTQTTNGLLTIYDLYPTSINELDLNLKCLDDSIVLTAIGSGGSGIYQYDWLNSDSDSTHDVVSIVQNGTYNYPVKLIDLCYEAIIDTVTVVMNQTLAVDTVFSTPASCEPDGSVTGLGTGITGIPYYHWNGPGKDNTTGFDATSWHGLAPYDNTTEPPVSSGWYYLTVTDDVCEVYDSVYVDIKNVPNAQAEATPSTGCSPLEVVLTNNSENASHFYWDFGNGQTINVSDKNQQTQTYEQSAAIQLIAEPGPCADTTFIFVTVEDCPMPEVGTANVFSPNGDGFNDVFYLDSKETSKVNLIILNRWGNKVYEFTGSSPAWNGKTQNGLDAEEGVYFYKYIATGLHGEKIEGHGFLHLIRQ
jgi:gliding motility-associated-like protein